MDWDEIAERKHFVQCYDWASAFISQRSAIPGWVSSFRPDSPSSELVEELWGSFNRSCHIRFSDGVEWLVRFAMPGKVMDGDEKLYREVAVMRLVREKTNIPVPKVHFWGLSNENTLGLGPFIIMDFVQGGESLHHLWRESPDKRVLRSDVSEVDLRTVYRQIAGFYLELSKLEFPHAGSLCIRDDQSIHADLGPLTLKMQEIEAHGGVKVGGNRSTTFSSAKEFFEYVAEQDMEQLYKQVNSVDDADDARAKYKFRHQFNALIPRFVNEEYNKMKPRLLCDDFRYGNMIVNAKALKIIAVIDWEWTYAAPYQMFCSAPRWLLIKKPAEWPTPIGAEFDRYKACLDLFLDELEHLESESERDLEEPERQESESEKSRQRLERLGVENGGVCEPPECLDIENEKVSKRLGRLRIGSAKASNQLERPEKLSAQMRKSMTDGTFWFHELMYDCYTNAENPAWKAICSLHPDFEELTPIAEQDLREFAERKVKELEAYKVEWGEIKAYLEEYDKANEDKAKADKANADKADTDKANTEKANVDQVNALEEEKRACDPK